MRLSQRRTRIVGRLRTRKTREREGLVLVEGVRACRAALDADAEVSFAVVAPPLGSTEAGAELRERLAGVELVDVSEAELDDLSDTSAPQGVLLVCREPEDPPLLGDGARWLVLDGVQDPGNAGTLVRGAVAFGLDGVVCLEGTVDPWGAKAVRASAGLVFRAGIRRAPTGVFLKALDSTDVPLLVADAGGESAEAWRGAARWALVVGNEGSGVGEELRRAADAVVAIRMEGPAESLNAGVAGSILMHTLSSHIDERSRG